MISYFSVKNKMVTYGNEAVPPLYIFYDRRVPGGDGCLMV
jgi:hypothetical protein